MMSEKNIESSGTKSVPIIVQSENIFNVGSSENQIMIFGHN